MLLTAVILFGIAALGGLVLATLHFRDKTIPLPLALLHGLVGASGLATLGWAVFGLGVGSAAAASLGLFVLAALGGFFLFSYHLRQQRLPSPVVIIHALVAVSAFLLLVTSLMKA